MFRHRYYDALGKRKEVKRSGFTSEKEALRSLLQIKADILDNGPNFTNINDITVSAWLEIWYETYYRSWKIKTRNDISAAIKLHIKPLLGKHKLRELTFSIYKRVFINVLLDSGLAPGTVRLFHKYFMMAINAAVRDDIIQENKFKNIRIENKQRNNNFLTPEELNIFLKYAQNIGNRTEYTFTLLLAYSGMRKGEAMGLLWNDICFNENKVTIKHTRDNIGSRSPKTHQSYRTIELDPIVIKQLYKYQKWCIEIKLSLGIQHNVEKDFVFINDLAEPVHEIYINNFFDKLYRFFKNKKIDINRITPHGLRHTHATILIDALVPPGDVATRLGNTLEMIYKVYAHKFNKQNSKAATAFGKQLKQSIK